MVVQLALNQCCVSSILTRAANLGNLMNKIDSFSGEYYFLSNFYPKKFLFQGTVVKTSEHAFQGMKADNAKERKNIFKARNAAEAKRLGRRCSKRSDWENVKYNIMVYILQQKFKDRELQEKLLATGNAYLEEGNTWGDTTWGTVNGVGKNWLGKALMEVRDYYARIA